MNYAMESGYEIWHMECWESLQGRLTEVASSELAKCNLDLVAVQEVMWT